MPAVVEVERGRPAARPPDRLPPRVQSWDKICARDDCSPIMTAPTGQFRVFRDGWTSSIFQMTVLLPAERRFHRGRGIPRAAKACVACAVSLGQRWVREAIATLAPPAISGTPGGYFEMSCGILQQDRCLGFQALCTGMLENPGMCGHVTEVPYGGVLAPKCQVGMIGRILRCNRSSAEPPTET